MPEKLKTVKKEDLYREYILNKKTQCAIAEEYGVDQTYISLLMRKYGISTGVFKRGACAKDKIFKNVSICHDSGCWLWIGTFNHVTGYGLVPHNRINALAHRLSYEAFVSAIPVGAVIDHICRNRLCVNPTHLEAVSQKENIMRGIGLAVVNKNKTHCKNGHELSGSNLYITPDSRRMCKVCGRQRDIKSALKRGGLSQK